MRAAKDRPRGGDVDARVRERFVLASAAVRANRDGNGCARRTRVDGRFMAEEARSVARAGRARRVGGRRSRGRNLQALAERASLLRLADELLVFNRATRRTTELAAPRARAARAARAALGHLD